MRRLIATIALVAMFAALAPALALTATRQLARQGTADRVDPHLRTLLDRSRPGDRLTIFVDGPSIDASRIAAEAAGLVVIETFDAVGVTVAVGSTSQIHKVIADSAVTYVEADRPIDLFLDTSHIATRGAEVQRGFTVTTEDGGPGKDKGKGKGDEHPGKGKGRPGGTTTHEVPPITGAGVSIAVVDSGIDGNHAMFQDEAGSKVVRNLRLVCHAVLAMCTGPVGDANDDAWIAAPDNDSDTMSMSGHGTHVASTAAGVAVTTGDGETLVGAAPGAKLVGLGVGASRSIYGGSSGLNWVLEHHADPCGTDDPVGCPPIRVVNNSWGPLGGGAFNPQSVTSQIQDELVKAGVVVVWAAGNDGGNGSRNLTNPPGASPTPGILSVAAYDDKGTGTRNGTLASFSSRGDQQDKTTWPDISAPGAGITAACTRLGGTCGVAVEDNYATVSGTSMAAPHVAGIVAQLFEAKPELTPAEIEDTVEDTAYQYAFASPYVADLEDRNADHSTSFDKGHGLVDAKAAVARVLGIPFEQDLAPRLACVGGTQVARDDEGDTTDRGLDLTDTHLLWDGVTLKFQIGVADLRDAPPSGRTGAGFYAGFNYGPGRYFVAGGRELTQLSGVPPTPDSTTFSIGYVEPTATSSTYRTVDSGLAGVYDAAADVVTIHLTQADIDRANAVFGEPGTPPDLPALADGAAAQNLVIESFGTTGAGVSTPSVSRGAGALSRADSADGGCDFVLGSGAVDETLPPAQPEPGPDGAVSPESATYQWTSDAITDVVLPFTGTNAFGCDGGRNNTACDSRRVDVQVPAEGGILTVKITSQFPNDFWFYVYDPAGLQVVGATIGEASLNVAEDDAGVYTVVVRAFAAVDTTYDGEVTLSPPPPPPPPADGCEPSQGADGCVPHGGSYHWTGDPAVDAYVVSDCLGPNNPACDNERVELLVPEGGAELRIQVTAAQADEDFDVYVYAPDGSFVTAGAQAGDEDFSVRVTVPGIYTISVSAFLGAGSYAAAAMLS